MIVKGLFYYSLFPFPSLRKNRIMWRNTKNNINRVFCFLLPFTAGWKFFPPQLQIYLEGRNEKSGGAPIPFFSSPACEVWGVPLRINLYEGLPQQKLIYKEMEATTK